MKRSRSNTSVDSMAGQYNNNNNSNEPIIKIKKHRRSKSADDLILQLGDDDVKDKQLPLAAVGPTRTPNNNNNGDDDGGVVIQDPKTTPKQPETTASDANEIVKKLSTMQVVGSPPPAPAPVGPLPAHHIVAPDGPGSDLPLTTDEEMIMDAPPNTPTTEF